MSIFDSIDKSGTEWQERAACNEWTADLFYPRSATDSNVYIEARKVCALCPVQVECLSHALSHDEQHGMWGGRTPNERQQILKNLGISRKAKAKAAPAISVASLTLTPFGRERIDIINDSLACGRDPEEIAALCGVDIFALERWLYRVNVGLPWVSRARGGARAKRAAA
jgi:hypothetical protein